MDSRLLVDIVPVRQTRLERDPRGRHGEPAVAAVVGLVAAAAVAASR
jgi:hypothetical protein